jgi:hypothetical protein
VHCSCVPTSFGDVLEADKNIVALILLSFGSSLHSGFLSVQITLVGFPSYISPVSRYKYFIPERLLLEYPLLGIHR